MKKEEDITADVDTKLGIRLSRAYALGQQLGQQRARIICKPASLCDGLAQLRAPWVAEAGCLPADPATGANAGKHQRVEQGTECKQTCEAANVGFVCRMEGHDIVHCTVTDPILPCPMSMDGVNMTKTAIFAVLNAGDRVGVKKAAVLNAGMAFSAVSVRLSNKLSPKKGCSQKPAASPRWAKKRAAKNAQNAAATKVQHAARYAAAETMAANESQAEVAKLQAKVNSLQAEVAAAQAYASHFEAIESRLESRDAALSASVDRLDMSHNRLESELRRALSELTQSQEDKVTACVLCARCVAADMLLAAKSAEVDQLRVEVTAVRATLSNTTSNAAELELEHVALREKYAALSQGKADVEAKHAALGKIHAALGKEKAELEVEHAALGEMYATLGKDKAELEVEHVALGEMHSALSQGKAEVEPKHTALDETHAALDKGKAELEVEDAALGKEKSKMDKGKAELKAEHAALDETHAALSKGKTELEVEHAALGKRKTEMVEGKAELKVEHAALDETQVALDKGKAELEVEHATLVGVHAALGKEKATLEVEPVVLKEDRAKLDAQHVALNKGETEPNTKHAVVDEKHTALEMKYCVLCKLDVRGGDWERHAHGKQHKFRADHYQIKESSPAQVVAESELADTSAPLNFCEVCNLKVRVGVGSGAAASEEAAWERHLNGRKHQHRIDIKNLSPMQQSAKQQRAPMQQSAKQQRGYCEFCAVDVGRGANMWERHINGKKHQANAQTKGSMRKPPILANKTHISDATGHFNGRNKSSQRESGTGTDWRTAAENYCEVCELTVRGEASWERHLNGKKHKKVVSQLG